MLPRIVLAALALGVAAALILSRRPWAATSMPRLDEIARLLDLTDPALIGLCFDTGHYTYGGGDPLDGLRRFGDRISYAHFKDCSAEVAARARAEEWDYQRAVRHGIFCELGQGTVDFPATLAWLRSRGYDGWVTVEQDVLAGMGTPKESAARNREYLRSIGV